MKDQYYATPTSFSLSLSFDNIGMEAVGKNSIPVGKGEIRKPLASLCYP